MNGEDKRFKIIDDSQVTVGEISMAELAVILSGCGVRDGSEIHEATCTLLALAEANIEYQCFAPDIPQKQVMNHITNTPMEQTRNVLIESARIARGKIKPLSDLNVSTIDGLIFPGGMGAVTNLCTFAHDGISCSVNPDVERTIIETHRTSKPIVALCIAPVLIARTLSKAGIKGTVTIGNDPETAKAIESMGFIHKECSATDCVVDEENKLITTPAYMLASSIAELYIGIKKTVNELVRFL